MQWSNRTQTATCILIALLLAVSFSESAFAKSTRFDNGPLATPMFRVQQHKGSTALATIGPTGFSPAQIRSAYNLPASGGNGRIAIIAAYDCPTAQPDFVTFSQQFGLPTDNFEKHKMTSNIRADVSWALEISLDVQWAHAIAPNASILLVEAKSNLPDDLMAAVSYATNRPDVVAVSMSWGINEFSGQTSYDAFFNSGGGVAFFAASGDNGAGVSWPSTSPNVVAVGGTTLTLNANGSVASETAWSGSGGGVSSIEPKPAYQAAYGLGFNSRAVPDVSYNGNPISGFSVYDTTPYNGQTGWFVLGGTSAGAPQWAAIHSLGFSASDRNLYANAKWNNSAYFRDIIAGSNGAYTAVLGYDLVTGLGSPIAWDFALPLNVSAGTDRARYVRWSYVGVNVAVSDPVTGVAVQGVSVNASVYDTYGRRVWTSVGSTDSSGQVHLIYKLVFDAQMGNYRVTAMASLGGYQHGTGQTTFFSLG
jgi:subtilase family serine protease